jgi:hypothetical protein
MPIINNKYFHGPSLHTDFKSPNNSVPSLLWSEFVIVRVCYGPSLLWSELSSYQGHSWGKTKKVDSSGSCKDCFSWTLNGAFSGHLGVSKKAWPGTPLITWVNKVCVRSALLALADTNTDTIPAQISKTHRYSQFSSCLWDDWFCESYSSYTTINYTCIAFSDFAIFDQ